MTEETIIQIVKKVIDEKYKHFLENLKDYQEDIRTVYLSLHKYAPPQEPRIFVGSKEYYELLDKMANEARIKNSKSTEI